jgi:hypothetical protein
MKLKISEGNSKIGRVPNISLPPIKSCRLGVPCFKDCYAMKAYRQYANVRSAWDNNLELYNKDWRAYFVDLDDYLFNKRPDRFRFHVAGDIIDQKYLAQMLWTASMFPDTKFLAFTKRYDLDMSEPVPDNLTLVLSVWPGMELPEKTQLPWAWLAEDVRRPKKEPFISCPGKCDSCSHKCWGGISSDLHVVFERH